MSDASELELRLRDEKLKSLAEFAAGAGHEINNPVATIVGYVQQLLPGETDPDRIVALQTIGAQAYRIRDMIGDVMLFARPPVPRKALVDLAAVVDDIKPSFADELEGRRISWKTRLERPLTIQADPTQIRVLLSELVRNSIAAVPLNGGIVVEANQFMDAGRRAARLTITDDGAGISAEALPHLFDPFYSGRQAGRGLGFGLAKAWRIADMHGARLEVDSPPAGGAVLTLIWPSDD